MLQSGDRSIVRTSLNPPLCRVDAIPEDGVLAAEAMIDGEACDLLLTREAGEVRAFHNVCPHAGRRLDWAPGRFLVDKGLLVCAVHGAMFRRDDGECVSGPCRGQSLVPVPVDVCEGQVHLAG